MNYLIMVLTDVVVENPIAPTFWENLLEFIGDNFPTIAGWLFTTLAVIIGAIIFIRKTIPKFTNKLGLFLGRMIVSIFGGDPNAIANGFEQLPLVAEINRQSKERLVDMELRLIDLKSKLISNKLNETERMAYQRQYDKILEEFGGLVSEETLDTLRKLEEKA